MIKKKKQVKAHETGFPRRIKLSAEESLKRMEDFPKRREKFIASIRKGKNRGDEARTSE